jgi:hypothetical protein
LLKSAIRATGENNFPHGTAVSCPSLKQVAQVNGAEFILIRSFLTFSPIETKLTNPVFA